jgi:hypothetical protein
MRANYQQHGVKEFYQEHGGEYRNPHNAMIASTFPKVGCAFPTTITLISQNTITTITTAITTITKKRVPRNRTFRYSH